jgi:hypothetical protein
VIARPPTPQHHGLSARTSQRRSDRWIDELPAERLRAEAAGAALLTPAEPAQLEPGLRRQVTATRMRTGMSIAKAIVNGTAANA